MKLLLDVNVVLDVLADRKPWARDSAAVLAAVERGMAEGAVAAHTITTLSYLLGKHLGTKRSRAVMLDLLKLVSVAPVDEGLLLKALALGWPDFEDAVQAVTAVEIGAQYLVTRNPRHFKGSTVAVVTPAAWVRLLDQT